MKRILQLLVCGLGIGLLFSSCSMFNYTTYTAKTMGIENRIVQMPTVVDLVVDSMRHEKDTVWENILFKQHTSVKNQMDYLIASILEESGADVLVEPKASLDTKMSWIRSNYKLSVTGYPARYVNFRPATMEDMLLLGMDTLDCRGDYPQVIINGAPGNWYDSRSVNRRMEAKGGGVGLLSKVEICLQLFLRPKRKRKAIRRLCGKSMGDALNCGQLCRLQKCMIMAVVIIVWLPQWLLLLMGRILVKRRICSWVVEWVLVAIFMITGICFCLFTLMYGVILEAGNLHRS